MKDLSNKNKIAWLERVRANSWESEILIVGFVLIILIQTMGYFDEVRIKTLYLNSFYGNVSAIVNFLIVPNIFYVFSISNNILVISFSIYLIMRGFWVGVIGLSSVFPEDLNIKKINFNKFYHKRLYNYDIDDYATQIDKICSSIFSISFIIIMFIISILIFLGTFIILMIIIDKILSFNNNYYINTFMTWVFIYPYFLFGTIHFIDFILLGPIRRFKGNGLGYLFYKINNLFGIITLTRFYEILFLTFISEMKKRYIFSFIIILLCIVNFIDNWKVYNFDFYNDYLKSNQLFSFNYYEDTYEKHLQLTENQRPNNFNIMIQSGVVQEPFLKLHIPYSPQINNALLNECDKAKNKITYEELLQCIDDIFIILLDGKIITDLEWTFESHPYRDRKGYFTVIEISKLIKGKHLLKVQTNKNYQLEDKFNLDSGLIAGSRKYTINQSIPFYYYPK